MTIDKTPTDAYNPPYSMVEQEHNAESQDAVTPAEAGIAHVEPGPAVEFALLPGQRVEFSVSSDGVVTLRVTTPDAATVPEVLAAPAELPTTPALEKPAQERVTITGRVGSAPTFRSTAKGVRVARLTVAEHPDTESTTWRTVLAFGKRAQGLQTKPLAKGQAVEVVGYLHQRDVVVQGVKKTVEEIYATAIKRR